MLTPVHWVETGARGRLGIMARPRGGDWLEDELKGLARGGVRVLVSMLTDDEATELGLSSISAQPIPGLDFVRFPIPDREVPSSEPDALEFARALHLRIVNGDGVAIHCRMGIGRSSLMAALVLRLCGANTDEAFKRLSAARGFTVPDTAQQRLWVANVTL